MTPKKRFILLLILIALFLIVAPYLVFYSLGYRFDIKNAKIVATGGIYVRVEPSQSQVTVNNKLIDTTNVFSNSVFVQNLLPGTHNVSIKQDGYYDYQKNLLVKEKEVTKLENVVLFSKNIPFDASNETSQFNTISQKPQEKFIIRNGNLYYSNSKENADLTAQQKASSLIKGVVSFKVSGSNIIWLGSNGNLNKSDLTGQNPEKLSQTAIKIESGKSYRLEIFSGETFLKSGNSLLILNQETKSFQPFYSPVKDFKLSPDGQKLIFFNDNEILISTFEDSLKNKEVLAKTADKIVDCFWLNSDYIIFNHGNKLTISEIDYRGNVNIIDLPEKLILTTGGEASLVNPKIFFEQSSGKLYILNQKQLLSSDKILP